MEAASGFEPLNNGFADHCLSHLATPPCKQVVEREIINRELFFDKENMTMGQKVSGRQSYGGGPLGPGTRQAADRRGRIVCPPRFPINANTVHLNSCRPKEWIPASSGMTLESTFKRRHPRESGGPALK